MVGGIQDVEGIQDGWRNTGWLEEHRMVGGIQDGWRNTGWLEEYRIVGGTQDG